MALHPHVKVELLLIYLSFFKIVHQGSSLLVGNSQGTRTIILFYIQSLIKNLI